MSEPTPVEIAVAISRESRRERIILRLSEGLTPIPKLAREYGISPQRVHSIAKAAEKRGELERIPGLWPTTFRAGPNLAQEAFMGHEPFSPQKAILPVRFHALQAKMAVTDLTRADLSGWRAWDTRRGTMARVTLKREGLKVHLRGSENPILVVDLPPITVDVPYGDRNTLEMHISKAVALVKIRVSEAVTTASRICRENYGIITKGPATWYRPPEIAVERFPGLPKGARYRIAYVWVDSSTGLPEAETDSLPTLQELMEIANRVHHGLSQLSTFDMMPMIGDVEIRV